MQERLFGVACQARRGPPERMADLFEKRFAEGQDVGRSQIVVTMWAVWWAARKVSHPGRPSGLGFMKRDGAEVRRTS